MFGRKATNINGQALYGANAVVSMTPLMRDKARPITMRTAVLVLANAMGWDIVCEDMMISFE
jgi:hypothetical protein